MKKRPYVRISTTLWNNIKDRINAEYQAERMDEMIRWAYDNVTGKLNDVDFSPFQERRIQFYLK